MKFYDKMGGIHNHRIGAIANNVINRKNRKEKEIPIPSTDDPGTDEIIDVVCEELSESTPDACDHSESEPEFSRVDDCISQFANNMADLENQAKNL